MRHLIETFLYENNYVPLMGKGSLLKQEVSAKYLAGEKMMQPPSNLISFSFQEKDPNDWLNFISKEKNVSFDQAKVLAETVTDAMFEDLDNGKQFDLLQLGIVKNDLGKVEIINQNPKEYFVDVPAEKVIHPNKSHEILVGDRNTDSNQMSAYYADIDQPKNRNKWWIGAVVFLLIAIAAIVFYFMNGGSGKMGNQNKIVVDSAHATYSIPQK